MKHALFFFLTLLGSMLNAQESIDSLTFVKTTIKVPDGCSVKSKYEIIDCNGFSAQWLYLKEDMVNKGIHKQLFTQVESQFNYSKKLTLKYQSRGEDFEGFQYKMNNGSIRILGWGKIDQQWLILNLGFKKAPKKNSDLSAFEKEFIGFEK